MLLRVAVVLVMVLHLGYSQHILRQDEGVVGVLGMTEECLGCICEATTGCNLSFNCSSRGFCGPLLISQDYWVDGGRPVVRGDNPHWTGAFFRCAKNPTCSGQTVKNYMERFGQDCDGDGRVDCEDLARVHYLGGHRCKHRMNHTPFYRDFLACQASVQLLNG